MVVLFSRDMPNVESHNIAVRTKVESLCMDFMVVDRDFSSGNADRAVVVDGVGDALNGAGKIVFNAEESRVG